MPKTTKTADNSLVQLRMGIFGAATAMVCCFAAAFAFAGVPTQAAETEIVSAEN